MSRKVPIVPTLLVAVAVAALIGLGEWQLRRAEWKQGLIDRYSEAGSLPPISWPVVWPKPDALPYFRRATGVCLKRVGHRAVAGANAKGETGYVQIVDCATGAEGPGMSVEIGWSADPNARSSWAGGPVSGVIAPDKRSQIRLVATTPASGLQPSRAPSVESISSVTPAGHRGYAATWFAFAAIAVIVYVLALRRRRQDSGQAR